MYVRDQRWLFFPPGWSHPVMCVHFHSEVRYKHFWGRASSNVKHWTLSCEVHIIWQFSYSYWNCNVFIMQLYCSYNAGHVKQGLKCKHCRVNIHHICGAKVRHFSILLDPFLRWVSACQRKRRICWNGMGRSRPKVGGGEKSFQRRTGYREECAYVPACKDSKTRKWACCDLHLHCWFWAALISVKIERLLPDLNWRMVM